MDAGWARKIWDGSGIFFYALRFLLAPFSFLYGMAVRIRNLLYSVGWRQVQSLPRTVVSVGNLTVGGTGKTPTAIWLAVELKKAGYRVAILSRGYKRAEKQFVVVEPVSEPASVFADNENFLAAGDEPLMMAHLFGQKVGVGKDRYEVGERILRDDDVDVFILDDGFQHRQLCRDIDLLLLGADWNGRLLPAGPFREPRSAAKRASHCLVTGSRDRWQPLLSRRAPATVFFGALEPRVLLTLESGNWKEYPLTLLDRSKILAVTAIADPAPFYRMIHDWDGEIVDTVRFPDHHVYSARDWQRINRAAHSADFILTTEKDIIKLARFPFAKEKLLALRVGMTVEDGAALVGAVERAIEAKRAGSA
ncbi:MAG TPA: tetraacyldisaccharide 4'-kinase [Candidatus Binatia bacterium]